MADDGESVMDGVSPFVLTDAGYILTQGSATVRAERPRFFGPRTTHLAVGGMIEPKERSVADITLDDGTTRSVVLLPGNVGALDAVALLLASAQLRCGQFALVGVPLFAILLASLASVHLGERWGAANVARMAAGVVTLADEGRSGFHRISRDIDPEVAEALKAIAGGEGDDR